MRLLGLRAGQWNRLTLPSQFGVGIDKKSRSG